MGDSGVTVAGGEVDHYIPSSIHVKKDLSYTSTPTGVFVACTGVVNHLQRETNVTRVKTGTYLSPTASSTDMKFISDSVQ